MTKRHSAPKKSQPEDVFELEDIVEYKHEAGKDMYFVKWKGFASAENTWEPSENILNPGADVATKMTALKMRSKKKQLPKQKTEDVENSLGRSSATRRSRKSNEPDTETQKLPTSGEGSCSVMHIGKGIGNPKNYSVTIKWTNGFEEIQPVSQARLRHGPELLDYLLSRVRFRDDK